MRTALFAVVVHVLGRIDHVRNPTAQARNAGKAETPCVCVIATVELDACDAAMVAMRALDRCWATVETFENEKALVTVTFAVAHFLSRRVTSLRLVIA